MKYFPLILLQPVNPCNSIISTVTHRAARERGKKMNMQQIMKMAIEAYCEITGADFNFVANECATNFDGAVSQAVLMIAVMSK